MQGRFLADVLRNPNNRAILDRWNLLALPDGWLVAGYLFQTVWNLKTGRSPEADIKDYNLFYFDTGDTRDEGESGVQQRTNEVQVQPATMAGQRTAPGASCEYP